jgi:hypothetical protein
MAGDDRRARRITALNDQVRRVRDLVVTLDDPTPEGRVRATLAAEVVALEEQLGCLPAEPAPGREAAPAVADGDRAAAEWQACSDLAGAVQRLAQLALALQGGFAARRAGLDDGMCALADALLHEISALGGPAWVLATIPAEADLFSERDGLIRLRWPGEGVWTLPLALHELGHFVGRRLEQSERIDEDRWAVLRPLEDRLRTTGEEVPADWHHLHELFADAYATYVGGPSYLGCCVTTALYPSHDLRDDKTHPIPSRRVAVGLEILRRMNASPGNTASLAFEIEAWRGHWADVVKSAGGAVDLVVSDADLELVEFMWTTLRERLPNARYRTLNMAKELAGRIRNAAAQLDSAAVAGATAADALNASWCARHQEGDDDAASLERRSRRLLEVVASRG